jgi:3-methyladenine DNA glycosylase AlkD
MTKFNLIENISNIFNKLFNKLFNELFLKRGKYFIEQYIAIVFKIITKPYSLLNSYIYQLNS